MIYKTLGDLAPALVDTTDLSRTNALEFWESNINISFSFFHLWSLLHIVPSAWKALSTNPLATPFTWLTFLWSSTQRDLPPLPSSVCVSCSVMSNPLRPMDWSRPGSSVHGILQADPWDSPGMNTGVSCHFLLQGIFPTQESNLCLLWLQHCRQILYHLSHQGGSLRKRLT